jgi:hypothetical protein
MYVSLQAVFFKVIYTSRVAEQEAVERDPSSAFCSEFTSLS